MVWRNGTAVGGMELGNREIEVILY